jgi:aspartyl-tRNA(Asn)/glutamyl-tRNA(Gln) amidotransferase subunit A
MFQISQKPTIAEIHSLYLNQKASVTDVVNFFLNRSNHKDKLIHSVLRHTTTLALQKALELDNLYQVFLEKYKDHDTSVNKLLGLYPLFGIPFNLKDNIMVEGQIATSASLIMQDYVSPYSASVYKILDQAGGVLISQSNLDEWAVGSSTENSAFGVTLNPFDSSRVPGGSSGGPAANVGAGLAVFSLGSDTGGSIRQPASFCNVVGLKPTYGLISRFGVMPLASSLDQVGAFTNCVEDNVIITALLIKNDPNDQTNLTIQEKLGLSSNFLELQKQLEQYKLKGLSFKNNQKFKIGLPQEYFDSGLDPLIKDKITTIVNQLQKNGHTIVPVTLPLTKYGLAVYYTTMTVETASNLQRFDGIRFGKSNSLDQFFGIREQKLGDEPKRRIMLGTFASSSGYYDAYYNQACKVKTLMTQELLNIFKSVDLLIAPTSPEFAFKFNQKSDPLTMYLSDILLYSANLTKTPSISVPMSMSTVEDGSSTIQLPSGIQIMSAELQEDKIYYLALELETIAANL